MEMIVHSIPHPPILFAFVIACLAFHLMNRSPFKWKSLEQFASFLMDANIFEHSVSSFSAFSFANYTKFSTILLAEKMFVAHDKNHSSMHIHTHTHTRIHNYNEM